MIVPLFSCVLLWGLLQQTTASPMSLPTRTAALGPVWPGQHYVSENFTAPDMKVSRNGETAEGYLFLTPMGSGTTVNAPVIISDSNELIWRGPAGGWTYNNFKVQQLHDQPVLTSWYGNSSATFGHGYGAVSIWDDSYTEVYKICPSNLDIVTPGNLIYNCYLDMHESYLTDQGTLIASAYNVTQANLTSAGGPADGYIFDSVFYEIDLVTQEVLFRWRSLDHLPRIPLHDSHFPFKVDGIEFATNQTLPWDYFHINSVQPLSDGYLVNSRHMFSMYKVSKTTGNVEWHLSGQDGGDFNLEDDIFFSWQHMPRVSNVTNTTTTITLFNNDNSEAQQNEGTNGTTGLSLHLDLSRKHVSLNRRLQDTTEKIVADSQGSYQVLEAGHALIGYGQIATTREFDAAGNVIYEAQYGYSNASSPVASYRSYRQLWAAQPANPPKLAVKCNGNAPELYLSWNGATAYTRWIVYAGNSSDALKLVGEKSRDGFETSYILPGGNSYALAAAVVDETVLANSSLVKVDC